MRQTGKSNYQASIWKPSVTPTVDFPHSPRPAPIPVGPMSRPLNLHIHDTYVSHPDYFATRTTRMRTVYGSSYDSYLSRPVVVYHDPFDNVFFYWLMAQSLDTQANWVYHHQRDMDQARYSNLVAQNASLATRVQQLETLGVARDATYVAPGIDPDLQYDQSYAEQVVQPTVAAAPVHFGNFLLVCVALLGVVAIIFWGVMAFGSKGIR